MNRTFLLVLNFGLGFLWMASSRAQFLCGTDRFRSNVFTQVTTTSNIQYGSNPNGTTNLLMDVYEPQGDTLARRPLIIFAHGGSFISGSKESDNAIVDLCNRFAKMGYVTAPINYTLGFDVFPPNPESAARTVVRSVHEMKAAVRFFRKDAATSNQFRIDPDNIFVGGSSAGAFIALHLAYVDQPSEIPSGVDTTGLNGLEGICGNPGYPSHAKIVINLCGALGDTAWMRGNTTPVVSVHGTNDAVVPFGSAVINFLGTFPVMEVDGSASIDEQAAKLGIPHAFLIFNGDGHVPYQTNTGKMNQTSDFVRDFIYDYMCANASITPALETQNLRLWPVPAGEEIHFFSEFGERVHQIEIFDMQGKKVLSVRPMQASGRLDMRGIPPGFYALHIQMGSSTYIRRISKL
ncbi:MAG: alpha/beta hydrolase fold domain-containing protein [Flavobacteriales bacterium]|nr:alpha/beta hydrolase fold domain-containing protein [Flavobacteriales bacterium]MDW8432831.1 alpha/beta hydrolase fold domain-containing protein [Flavobacteriales bacterium]